SNGVELERGTAGGGDPAERDGGHDGFPRVNRTKS
ncbi:hypothetical protein A2U01_0083804, partial [Trifolium medium]|nr:hypothetical protein [Trifolium medium]